MGGVVFWLATKNGKVIVQVGSACQSWLQAQENGTVLGVVMALVRYGNGGSSCVSDDMAQEEDGSLMSERIRSDAGVETCTILPKMISNRT